MKKPVLWALALLAGVTTVLLASSSGGYTDQRARSPHFIDGQFRNAVTDHRPKSLWQALKMRWETDYAKWPDWIDSDYGEPPARTVRNAMIKVTVINHATVLIQGGGYNVLTDPVYSQRVSPLTFIGPERVRNPGIRFDDLPKIDAIVISHDHYDHLDKATLKKLAERDQPKIFAGLGVGKHLADLPNITEMDWWQSIEVGAGFRLSFVQVQHFSGRGLFDRFATLWGGFVLELAGKKIYFGGDSGYANHYKQTYDKFGAMDVALLPIGAYAPRRFMGYVHMDPAQAVQAHQDLRSKKSIGIHYGTFQLTAEGIDEPGQQLEAEVKKAGLAAGVFQAVEFGMAHVF